MKVLQETARVLFELMLSLGKDYPHQAMSPILKEFIKKAKAPFQSLLAPSAVSTLLEEDELHSLCFFPSLSRVRL